jgi:restriction system protein
MARRSKRNNSKDTAQFIAALIFLVALALSDGNLLRAAELFPSLVFIGLILGGIVLLLNILFRTSGGTGYHPGVSRNFTYQASVESVSDSAPAPPERVIPQRCTQELLNLLEWRRFELLVQALFQAEGKIASRIRAGADGGIDLALRESPEGPVTAIVQCKAWKAYTVGVKPVRELFGVMHAEGVPRAFFFTSGRFTSEALAFANGKPLDLIDGPALLQRLNALEPSQRDSILADMTAGDYATPSCPSCDTKMVRRTSKHGEFWGCRSYPRCKQTFNIRK